VLALVPVTPKALAMRSPEELEREVAARRDTEDALQKANADLEQRVAALRASEERFRLLVDGTRDYALFVLDPSGRVASWNPGAQRIKQYRAEEIVGQHFSRFYIAEDIEAGKPEKALRAAEAEGRYEEEGWRLRKDGSRFWANVIITALRDDGGRLRGFSKILRDMTERKAAQVLLQQQAEALREADRRKDEFLAMLAHELRNPLAPIRTGLDRLRLQVPQGSPLHPVLDVVERQVAQLTRLVGDLLDVSRITRGQTTLQKERVDLHAVIAQAVETARPLLDARRHDLAYTPSPEPLLLEADPGRLAQAISNLLSNAAKYTDQGGRIWLAAERDQGEAVVRVRDNGIGIEPGMLPRVFDLFTQGHPARGRSQGGLGVGLAVAKRLVEMHGGSVAAHSAGVGRGSEFVIRLPLSGESGGAATEGVRAGAGTPTGQAASRRILVVDDLVEVAEDMAALLREALGHDVRTAHDGPTALRAAAEFRPELVLLDLGLPGMSGYDVARRLRGLPGLGDVALVALTGWGQEDDRRKTREAGFNHHLVKPVGLKELQPLLAGLPQAGG
jgi:PAS domain S-box-containing protein